jgi:hypoxanthine-guanine phosphoribosyltransferase
MFNFTPEPPVIPKKITRDKLIEFIGDHATKRINFAGSHAHALKKNEKGEGGKITLPFNDTIGSIIHDVTGKDLFSSQYGGYWRGIYSDEEYASFEEFVNEYKDIVFLRDHLDLSLALSMNFEGDEHTHIGELEVQAKFHHNKKAEAELTGVCNKWIKKLPFLKEADYICAMPGSSAATESLPHRIVSHLEGFDFEDISDSASWTSKTRSVKDAESAEEKLQILEESGLQIAERLDLKGKTVLLFDDLYMSGLSMQYVAMKLKEAGAARVFGLCTVKSRSNTAR